MAKHFNYFDNWQSEILHCPRCGWSGTFDEGSTEYYKDVMDCSCPVCDPNSAPMLAIVSYPTLAECDAHRDKMSEPEQWLHDLQKQFLAAFEATSLKSEEELPDIDGDSLTLTWDFVDSHTVIKHREVAIWRECALFECKDRFKEVVDILKKKYGLRLVDVVPTEISETYLYGDDLYAPHFVAQVRESLRDHRQSTQL